MLAPASFPPVNPEALTNMKLAYVLAKANWQVHIIARPPNKKSPGRYPAETELFKHENIFIHSVPLLSGRPRLALAAAQTIVRAGFFCKVGLNWVYPAVEKALELTKNVDFSAVLSRTTPLYAHLAGLLFTKKTGIPWLANYADPDARSRYPEPYGQGPKGRVAPGTYFLSFGVSRYATHLTFPSRFLADYVCSYLPGNCRNKASVIPHVALPSLQTHKRIDTNEKMEALTIVHTGSTRSPRTPIYFFSGLNRFLASQEKPVKLKVIFCEHKPQEVRERVKDFGLSEIVEVRDPMTYAQSGELLARADIALLLEAPMTEGVFLPSKFADYVQASLPILALSPTVGTVKSLIESYGGGIAVDGSSPQEVAAALEKLYTLWESASLSEMAVGRLLTYLGPSAVATALEDLIYKSQ